MHLIRVLSVVIMCWTGLAAAANDIPMTGKQSQALGIETVPLAAPSSAAGNGQPAQVVIPNQQVRIVSAPLAGMVESMAVAVNQPVKKGQTLARLQSPMLAELQRDFLQTALQSQLAQSTLSRDEKLFKDGIVAESRYLAARNNAATQAAAAGEKRQALRLAGMSNAAMSKLQAGHAIDSALEVATPIDGVVLEQMVAPGQRVDAAAPLFKVARLSPLWLEIQVPLAQAGGLQAGASV
ncbi:MAG: efflux RND transporter periplasmic adaptor subunit, partial [Sulfuricella sp.]